MDPLGSVRYGAAIERAAARHGISPTLLAAVAAQETGGPGSDSGSNVVGDGGHGHGLFQIDDRSWAFAATPQAMDPERNADVAAGILASDLASTGGDVRGALSMYNAGSPTARGTQTTWSDGQTLGYADSVLRHAVHLEAMRGVAGGATAAQGAASTLAGAIGTAGSASPDATATTPSAIGLAQSDASLAAMLESSSASAFSPAPTSQPAPQKTWRDMVGASDAGQAADGGNADILDAEDIFGDVFGDGDASDA